MARVIFWDVDTQVDFMRADGKLYVPDAEQIIPHLKKLTDYAHGHGLRIVASGDDHVRDHPEISDTPDWRQNRPQTRVFAVTDAMKPIDRDGAETLLKEWGEEGVRLVKTSEVVVGGLVEQLARATA